MTISCFSETRRPLPQSNEMNYSKTEEFFIITTRYVKKRFSVFANTTSLLAEGIKKSPAQAIPDILKLRARIQHKDITGNRRFINVDLRGFGETAFLKYSGPNGQSHPPGCPWELKG